MKRLPLNAPKCVWWPAGKAYSAPPDLLPIWIKEGREESGKREVAGGERGGKGKMQGRGRGKKEMGGLDWIEQGLTSPPTKDATFEYFP